MLRIIGPLYLAAALLVLQGCQTPGANISQAKRPSPPQPQEPFMIREAKMPEGFPKPGPVGKVIVKTYPAHRLAKVTSDSDSENANTNRMFSPLFRHIKKNDIAMTSPVEMDYTMPDQQDAEAMTDKQLRKEMAMRSMAFYYGDQNTGETGTDGKVTVEDVGPQTVASVGVRGAYTSKHMTSGVKKLLDWINEQRNQGSDIRIVGPPRYLGYNSPFVPGFLKYGEVQIPVKLK